MPSFCPPPVLSCTLWTHVCTTVDQQITGKGQELRLGKEGKGRRQVLDSPPCHKFLVWSWLSQIILAEGDGRRWSTNAMAEPGIFPLFKCFCGTLTLLSGMKYHPSCDYSHQGTQISHNRSAKSLQVNFAVITAKSAVFYEYRDNKQKAGSSKDAVPKIPWGSCRQLGSPSMPARTVDVHVCVHHTQHNPIPAHHTPPHIPWVKKPQLCLFPPPLPPPFVPQTNLCLLAQTF